VRGGRELDERVHHLLQLQRGGPLPCEQSVGSKPVVREEWFVALCEGEDGGERGAALAEV